MAEIGQLAFLFILAAVTGIIARLLRQPLILAYLLVGIIIAIFKLTAVTTGPLYQLFADLGIMFLLFLVGMEINFTSLRRVGPTATVIGLGQIVFTFIGGFFIALLLGFDLLPAAYIAIALTFSSTIIIVKLLSEKRDLNSLYGKISIGFLLVQDFVAIIILLLLSGVQTGQSIDWGVAVTRIASGLLLFGVMILLGRAVMPHIFHRIARSPELLFIASIAWLFGVVTVIERIGFSIEIGGLLAGLALANSAEHFQISSRIKPLRDFFLLLFFVVLGAGLTVTDLGSVSWPVIAFSLFVLIGNPIIIMVIMGAMGYHRRTSFLAGVTVAQISEFSLVIAALGLKVGHLESSHLTLITMVGIVTIATSSYMILYADNLYTKLHGWLRIFERTKPKTDTSDNGLISRPILLIGGHHTGQNILSSLRPEQVAIVDFNPDLVTALNQQGWLAVYGDNTDPDLDELVDLTATKIIISTSPDLENNLSFLKTLTAVSWPKKRSLLLMRAETIHDAEMLYRRGADYVFIPALMSGSSIGHLVSQPLDRQILAEHRKKESIGWNHRQP